MADNLGTALIVERFSHPLNCLQCIENLGKGKGFSIGSGNQRPLVTRKRSVTIAGHLATTFQV